MLYKHRLLKKQCKPHLYHLSNNIIINQYDLLKNALKHAVYEDKILDAFSIKAHLFINIINLST
jgi:dTDP-4-dehydrorhamnose reductase